MPNVSIKLLTEANQKEYFLHCDRAISSGGMNGAPPYTPLGRETTFTSTDQTRIVSGWKLSPKAEGWNRVWGYFKDGQIAGSVMLNGASVKTKLHRSQLSIGIDDHQNRGQGIGSKLMTEAIDWAKKQESISWIDLSVFDTNLVATALYKKFGFKECGILKDHYRIEGKSFDHILMTVCIRTPS